MYLIRYTEIIRFYTERQSRTMFKVSARSAFTNAKCKKCDGCGPLDVTSDLCKQCHDEVLRRKQIRVGFQQYQRKQRQREQRQRERDGPQQCANNTICIICHNGYFSASGLTKICPGCRKRCSQCHAEYYSDSKTTLCQKCCA
jgi:hypothetical protein